MVPTTPRLSQGKLGPAANYCCTVMPSTTAVQAHQAQEAAPQAVHAVASAITACVNQLYPLLYAVLGV
jgi:hypothetical protein